LFRAILKAHTPSNPFVALEKKPLSIQFFFQHVDNGLVKRLEVSRLALEQFQLNLYNLIPLDWELEEVEDFNPD
jgi:hypothetical protein